MARHQVLWSGGFDSTFRVLQLLADGHQVEPIYIRQDPDWQKQRREQLARRRILAAIPGDWQKRVLEPPVGESSADMWAAYWKLWDTCHQAVEGEWWSAQDPMIAACTLVHPKIEACYVASDSLVASPARLDFLRSYGVRTPLIGLSKQQLLAEATRQGWADLLRLTWSCEATNEDAAFGPCGVCEPCRNRIVPAAPTL